MANDFKSYDQALNWLMYELPKTNKEVFRGDKGLVRAKKLLSSLDNPQDKYKTIHVAASSGKGTVAMMATQLLLANGHTVGTIMSPHVYDFRERFLVDGKMCGKKEVLDVMNKIKEKVLRLRAEGVYSTYYEVVLAIGYSVFSRYKLDYSVVEVGVGGRLDGSNCITRDDKISVIGQIGLDHTEILGETLPEIASEKAGIILEDSQVFALEQLPAVNEVFTRIARSKNARLTFVNGGVFEDENDLVLADLNTRLAGRFNNDNLALATVVTEYLSERDGWKFSESSVEQAISKFDLPGRFEIMNIGDKTIILDGAHSEQKLSALVKTIESEYSNKEFSVVFACGNGKNPEKLLKVLQAITQEVVFSSYDALKSDMKRKAYDFTGYELGGTPSIMINDAEQVVEYIQNSTSRNWLITGSFFLVSDVGIILAQKVKNKVI